MKKIVNITGVTKESWTSPKGKYASIDQEISVALGRDRHSLDLNQRHPFDVEVCTIPAGKASCPFHSHSAQFEYYQVLSGTGRVRSEDGVQEIGPGDAFLFLPGEAHQIASDEAGPLVVLIVADNPIGESCYYPDSQKWMVSSPRKELIRSSALDYLDGEE